MNIRFRNKYQDLSAVMDDLFSDGYPAEDGTYPADDVDDPPETSRFYKDD